MRTGIKDLLLVIGMGILVFALGTWISKGWRFDGVQDILVTFSLYQLYSFVLGYSNLFYYKYLETRDWKGKSELHRVLVGIGGATAISMLGLFLLRMFSKVVVDGFTVTEFMDNERVQNYYFGMTITVTVMVGFHILYYYNRFQKKKVKESQMVAKTETAKFQSLKSQLDPHFLFNSLNVLTSLIGENPDQAERFTTKLSKVYRYVLEQKDKDLIGLEEELSFASSYMQLLQMRFEEAISFKIPNSISNPDLKIVPLSLQLLLENAVKHNVITSRQPLNIEIFEQDNYLVVKNSLNPKTSIEKSTKVGLANINQRYALLTRDKVIIDKSDQHFIVKIPLLTQKINMMKTDYMNDNAKYLRAKKKVEELKEFYGSLVSYLVVIPFLIYINYTTSWHFQWFWFPMLGWGFGLVIQGFKTFGYGSDWEDRKIREIMEKDNNLKY